MNQRERLLAIAVGAMLLLVGGFMFQSYVGGQFTTRRGKVAELEGKLKKSKQQILKGQRATKKIGEFEARSLPPQPELARSLYQNWLLNEVGKAGLVDQQVRAISTQVDADLFVKQVFSITGKGTLSQTVDLLHAIYRVDHLHRVTLLTLKPIKESKLLDLTLTIEAVSLRKAPPATQLSDKPSDRLALPTREAYQTAIVGRNLFAPANQPPKLASLGTQRAFTSRSFEYTVKASDPDVLDRVSYKLVQASEPDVALDPLTGRFKWTPKSPGEYKFVVEASDDGQPSRTVRETLSVSVTVPPPPEPPKPAEPKKLAFDHAKFTVLTAVIDVSGESEVWLFIRPTGQTLKLHIGDEFEVGSVKGTVMEIGQTDFVFESDGKSRRLSKGEVLEQAVAFQQSGQTE